MLLSFILFILCLFTISLRSEDECCPQKDVGGKLYTFTDHISEEDKERLKCSSTCAYKHAEKEEQKFCFKPGKLKSECRNGDTKEKAIVITGGGDDTVRRKVEVLKKDGTPWCTLPDLPFKRDSHTQSGWTVCGGRVSDCTTFDLETRTWGSPVRLRKARFGHSSWTTSRGIVLMGGELSNSPMTSEIVTKSDSQDHFAMKYYTRLSCSIELPDQVIITGGFDGTKAVPRVSVYNHDGFVLDLPNLVDARWHHGCTSYIGNNDQRVFMVTGGTVAGGDSHLDTTEVLVQGEVSWRKLETAALPAAIRALKVITVGNEIFSTGGWTFKPKLEHLKSILHFNKETQMWKEVGNMEYIRVFHAMGLVDFDEKICRGN